PALPVWMVTVTRLGERSISTRLIAPRPAYLSSICFLTWRSCFKYSVYSRLLANHLERQFLCTCNRMLIGLTFWPITYSPLRLVFLPFLTYSPCYSVFWLRRQRRLECDCWDVCSAGRRPVRPAGIASRPDPGLLSAR